MKSSRIMKVAALAAVLGFWSANSSFGAAFFNVNLTNTVTATMDGGTTKAGNTWYERGVNTALPNSGIVTGLVPAQFDPFSDYLIQPANGLNALMLGTNMTTGSLNFTRPISVTALSLAGSSGNGTGTNALTLRFADGTSNTLSLTIGDWFNQNPRVETSNGRINIAQNIFGTNLFQNTLSNDTNSDNPRILAINANLALADQSKFLTGIDIKWLGGSDANGRTHTAIFGVSGDVTGIGHYTAIPLTPGSFNQDIIVGLAEVPEPGSLALMGLGLVGWFVRARRKNR